VKVLVYSASGDPLFVRDPAGHDFEVEVAWTTPRPREWANPETKWDEIWNQVCNSRPSAHGVRLNTLLPSKRILTEPPEPLIVKASSRVLTAHRLPPLEERAEREPRARALKRLGGDIPDDEVVTRRAETFRRWWAQLPEADVPARLWEPPLDFLQYGKTPMFTNIHAHRVATSYMETSTVTVSADPVQARREEAMRRLQDPPPEDFDPSVQQDIKYMLDGIRRRPVM
jgi:hypothetical protein